MVKRPAWGRQNWLLMPAALVFLGAFAAPLLFSWSISFWSVKARIMRPDFTLKNYVATWTDYYDVMGSTLLIAFAIAALTTLLAFGFAYAIRFKCGRFESALVVPGADHPVWRLSGEDLCLEKHPGSRGHSQPTPAWTGLIDQPLDALLYSVNGVVITLTYFLLPFAILPIYGNLRAIRPATIEAARDLGAGRWAVLARHRHSAMRKRHRHCLYLRFPDHGGRLRYAALRRRRRGDDGALHRIAILAWLQLADGERYGLYGHGRVAGAGHAVSRPLAPGAAAMSRLTWTRLGDFGWRAFALARRGLHGRAAHPGRAVQLQPIGADQPAA